LLVGVFTVLAFTASAAPAGTINLTIDWNGIRLDRPFPVTGGIPLARGALKDSRALRLTAGPRDVPVQTEVLAWWPDHSIKWLLLDFQAVPGERDLQLHYGQGNTPARPVQAVMASTRDGSVSINTGVLAFNVRAGGCGFLEDLSFRGARVFESAGRRLHFMDALHCNRPADYHPMSRSIPNAQPDPSQLIVTDVSLEKAGPLHAVVRIDGRYRYRLVGSTIEGTTVKGDCPFRLRLHAFAGQSLLLVEHFFCYEGDGDHDFVRALGFRLPVTPNPGTLSFIGTDRTITSEGPLTGLHQQTPDAFEVWNSDGKTLGITERGERFEGVLDVAAGRIGLAVGVRDGWQNAAKSLHADLRAGTVSIYLWPPESPPLDFRRHAREWSVGETGEPNDRTSDRPAPFSQPNFRLASKGVGKSHSFLVYCHDPADRAEDLSAVYQLCNRRPLLWAPAHQYAASLALGHYRERVLGLHVEIEEALDQPLRFWRHAQEHFRWYGFWIYGNVAQNLNTFLQLGRFEQDFGRWGWANGDSVGRLAYALMLQAVRKCERADLEFAEKYLYHVHDVCSTHSPAYPERYQHFAYLKGAAHRHGAWPWACLYTGIRGAHPVGAKIYYFLTGDCHARDILEEITQLSLKRPDGGMGDGPLGPNAQVFLYQWEATGKDEWRQRLLAEFERSSMKDARQGWDVMMHAAFGIADALEEYLDLTGDSNPLFSNLATRFADAALPAKMKRHWTWGGYFRVYASAYNRTRNPVYRQAIAEMLPVFLEHARISAAARLPVKDWPGPAGGPSLFVDSNIIRDIPFALFALEPGEPPG
jgi:hypothetical protein